MKILSNPDKCKPRLVIFLYDLHKNIICPIQYSFIRIMYDPSKSQPQLIRIIEILHEIKKKKLSSYASRSRLYLGRYC